MQIQTQRVCCARGEGDVFQLVAARACSTTFSRVFCAKVSAKRRLSIEWIAVSIFLHERRLEHSTLFDKIITEISILRSLLSPIISPNIYIIVVLQLSAKGLKLFKRTSEILLWLLMKNGY